MYYHGQAEVLNLVLEVLEARPYYGRASGHAAGFDPGTRPSDKLLALITLKKKYIISVSW